VLLFLLGIISIALITALMLWHAAQL
jgi:hypothetical protein